MIKKLLSGNEAIAQAVWEAGVAVASGYPGTPSTEILENLSRYPHIHAEWSPNEKVALEVAIGAAYAGRRAIATMKAVGLNVAADPLFIASMSGTESGLVILSADDPQMHSSQNEQDNRQYAKFARIPCLDPIDSQDAYHLTHAAFELGERFDTPVLLRLTTRVSHTTSPTAFKNERIEKKPSSPYPRNPDKYVLAPNLAVRRHPIIEQRILDLAAYAEEFPFNTVEYHSLELGIICGGVAYHYAREVFPQASILRLGMVYPLPEKMIADFSHKVEKLIVLEELDPFIEQQVRLMGIPLYAPSTAPSSYRKTIFPITGELSPDVVRSSSMEAGLLPTVPRSPLPTQSIVLPMRPPTLCPGCPHRAAFYVLQKLKIPVNGDIGCYGLGFMPPLKAIHTCGCMGESISSAHGADKAGDTERHVAVIGDSTFFHSGMTGLLNVAYNQSNVITLILDNRTTGMTGHQQNPGTGKTILGKDAPLVNLVALAHALGIEQVIQADGYDVRGIEKILKEWLKNDRPAVLILKRECALLPEVRSSWKPIRIDPQICNGCALCLRIGCPALEKSETLDPKFNRPLVSIDPFLCTGCQICANICPRQAMIVTDSIDTH